MGINSLLQTILQVVFAEDNLNVTSDGTANSTEDNQFGRELYRLTPDFVESVNYDETKNTISIYPNPGSDVLNMTSKYSLSDILVSVCDFQGRQVQIELDINANNFKIDTCALN
jgi:hypothetical protein